MIPYVKKVKNTVSGIHYVWMTVDVHFVQVTVFGVYYGQMVVSGVHYVQVAASDGH